MGIAAIHGAISAAGGYNSPDRDAFIVKGLVNDPNFKAIAAGSGFSPDAAKGFLGIGVDFITNACPQAFPKELLMKSYIAKFTSEAEDMGSYCGEMNFYMQAIPEFFSLCHPNAQVDNAFYWKSETGEIQCGLLDWGGVMASNIPTRIFKRDVWGTIKSRKDPRIDENFLLRCYWVQVYLWLKMWGLKNSPYIFFRQWMKRLKLPK